MQYAIIPPCAAVPMCAPRSNGAAQQTSIVPLGWLCVEEMGRRHASSLPAAPAPTKPPIGPSVPEIRARQKESGLPPVCRGAACTAKELVDSISSRFQILYQDLTPEKKMSNQHLLILLPLNDARAVADVQSLLAQHADYSEGGVAMSEQALKWLGHPRGAVEMDQGKLKHRANMFSFIKGSMSQLAELVTREGLGTPPALELTNPTKLQAQFAAWIAKARDIDVVAQLNQHANNIRKLHDALKFDALPGMAPHKSGKLKIVVLADIDAVLLNTVQTESFPGLIARPFGAQAPAPAPAPEQPQESSAPWNSIELTTRLRDEHKLKVHLMDLQPKTWPQNRSLAGTLLVAAVEGDASSGAEQLATGLMAGLRDTSSAKRPVTILRIDESLAVNCAHAQLQKVADHHLEKTAAGSHMVEQSSKKLLDFIATHTIQEPLHFEAAVAMGHQAFLPIVQARVGALAGDQVRQEGNKLLAAYESSAANLSEMHKARWKSVFNSILKVMDNAPRKDGMHVLLLPLDVAQGVFGMIHAAPELLAKLQGRTALARVGSVREQEGFNIL